MKSLLRPIILLVIVIAAIVIVVLYQNGELFPGEIPVSEEQAVPDQVVERAPDTSSRQSLAGDDAVWDSDRGHTLKLDYLEKLLAGVDRRQREQLLEDEQAFQQFVRQEADNQSILAAAYANELHKEDNMAFLMQRGAESVLRETYLNRLMLEQLPADFPTRDQAREFYEQNPAQFQIGERIQVWQVFLQLEPDAGQEKAASIEAQARDISKRLSEGKLDIAKAAAEYSAHEPSRRNGGYMGEVRVADLKPEIARALGELDTGAVGVTRSDEGWHILKKGEIIPPEKLEFDQIEDQVRRLLVNRARQEFRAAVYQQARNAYPQEGLTEERIEQWRRELHGQSSADWAR
jgi:peptidyl-prolyl cis-trans isomerase C